LIAEMRLEIREHKIVKLFSARILSTAEFLSSTIQKFRNPGNLAFEESIPQTRSFYFN
jgi:hypothetical protein